MHIQSLYLHGKAYLMDGSSAYWYGVANPQEIAQMTGREILQAIADGRLPHPPISQTLTFWLVEIGDGFAAFEGEPGDHLLNPMGTTHGGWAMTLIDSATGCQRRRKTGPHAGARVGRSARRFLTGGQG
jgi:acyl-coenzyme A thioesterase PaaI-like protein